MEYKEGLNIGYRWYDANGVTPAFPFGHGLSYTTFSMSKLEVTPKMTDGSQPINVQFSSRTRGTRRRRSAAGLSWLPADAANRQASSGFEKVWLNPGEKRKHPDSNRPRGHQPPLGYWDSDAQKWLIAAKREHRGLRRQFRNQHRAGRFDHRGTPRDNRVDVRLPAGSTRADCRRRAPVSVPLITDLHVIPVAGRDSMLLNLSGAHGPFFTRNIAILTDSAGTYRRR